MATKHWTLDEIPWADFDPARVDPDLLKVAKAASMVEYNGADYATYLGNVFRGDAQILEAIRAWAHEEVQHGLALGRWAEMADSSFDFHACFKRFTDGYQLPLGATRSVRGSRAGELVARCIVEVGTSSHYSALSAACEEPVLRAICRHIAADEFRHYKLFYTHLKRYLETENIGRWRRAAVVLGRIGESEDDELAYAYYAANAEPGEAYERKRWSRAYGARAFAHYRREHVNRGVAMAFKAAGLSPRGVLARFAGQASYRLLQARRRRWAAAA